MVRTYDFYSIKPLQETLKIIKEDLKNSKEKANDEEIDEEGENSGKKAKLNKKIDISKIYKKFLGSKRGR